MAAEAAAEAGPSVHWIQELGEDGLVGLDPGGPSLHRQAGRVRCHPGLHRPDAPRGRGLQPPPRPDPGPDRLGHDGRLRAALPPLDRPAPQGRRADRLVPPADGGASPRSPDRGLALHLRPAHRRPGPGRCRGPRCGRPAGAAPSAGPRRGRRPGDARGGLRVGPRGVGSGGSGAAYAGRMKLTCPGSCSRLGGPFLRRHMVVSSAVGACLHSTFGAFGASRLVSV